MKYNKSNELLNRNDHFMSSIMKSVIVSDDLTVVYKCCFFNLNRPTFFFSNYYFGLACYIEEIVKSNHT